MTLRRELAAVAAALVADSGLDYGAAKRRAARQLGLAESPPRGSLPDNDEIDEALREHLDLFDAEGHTQRRRTIRAAALELMQRLAHWAPWVTGAAWKGLVTEHALLHLQIDADHGKELAIDLINQGLNFEATELNGGGGGRARAEALIGQWRDWPVLIALHPHHELRSGSREETAGGAERAHRQQLLERIRQDDPDFFSDDQPPRTGIDALRETPSALGPRPPSRGQIQPRLLIGVALLVVLLLGLAASGGALWWQRPGASAEPAVQTLWAQQWPDEKGQAQALQGLRGKLTVVNFWATWCAPCVAEMPALSALYTELSQANPNLAFVGIAIDRADQVAAFSERTPVRYPVVVAGAAGSALARELGNDASALPFTVIIDREGKVVARTLGVVDPPSLWAQLLAQLEKAK